MKVTTALIVAWRARLSPIRFICARRATVAAAPTIPQIEASRMCSKLSPARTSPRAITRKQASQAPANISAAGRSRPLARKSSNAARILRLRLGIDSPSPLAGCDVQRGIRFCAWLERITKLQHHLRSTLGEAKDLSNKIPRSAAQRLADLGSVASQAVRAARRSISAVPPIADVNLNHQHLQRSATSGHCLLPLDC